LARVLADDWGALVRRGGAGRAARQGGKRQLAQFALAAGLHQSEVADLRVFEELVVVLRLAIEHVLGAEHLQPIRRCWIEAGSPMVTPRARSAASSRSTSASAWAFRRSSSAASISYSYSACSYSACSYSA